MMSLNSCGCCIATENMIMYAFGRFNLIEIPGDLIIVFFLLDCFEYHLFMQDVYPNSSPKETQTVPSSL